MYFEREFIVLPNGVVQGDHIDTEWLKKASPEEQKEALFQWFTNQYEDPVESLPYYSSEGGYIPIHGALVDPFDEFWAFGDIVSDEVIEEVAQELFDIAGDMWSPIPSQDEDFFEYDRNISPLEAFEKRINDSEMLIGILSSDNKNHFLLQMSVFSLFFTAFETYLWEVTKYNIKHYPEILKNLILNNRKDDIKNKAFLLFQRFYKGEVSDILAELEKTIHRKLDSEIIWHNSDNLDYVFKQGFGLNRLPNYTDIKDLLRTRNNIIHRFGMNIEGNDIELPDLDKAKSIFTKYCEDLDKLIQDKINEITMNRLKDLTGSVNK